MEELVTAVSKESGLTKRDSLKFIRAFGEVVSQSLVNYKEVKIIGFGIFSIKESSEREGRNPRTGEKVVIEKRMYPIFRASKTLKDLIKKVEIKNGKSV